MNIVIDTDLQELTRTFEGNSKFNVRSFASHEISNQAIKDSDAVFLRSTTKINEELLNNTNVKFVASLTSGEDHIDKDCLENLNIHLSTGKGGNSLAVVEYLLSVLSVLIIGNKIKPYETKFGIIGYGNIGKRFKNILDEINFPCCIYDPYFPEVSSSLDEVLSSEVISLNCSYSKTGKFPSHNLLDINFLNEMKDDQFLINSSRGEVLSDEYYLSKKSDNFIFDVWPNELHLNLTKFKKPYIATPHIAGKTMSAEYKLNEKALSEFNYFFNENIEAIEPKRFIDFTIDNSMEEEMDVFGIPPSIFLKIYDVKRDDFAFKSFFKKKEDPRDFQELRTSLKRLGFNNHKIVGDVGSAAKSKLELFGFRL
jgi:erythronate-4-phosphate dehydrogenase